MVDLFKPRSAKEAKNPSKIAYYAIDSLDTLVKINPEIAVKLIRTLASRLDRTTQKLIDTARGNPLWSTK